MDIYSWYFNIYFKYLFLSYDDFKNNIWKNKNYDTKTNIKVRIKRTN